jgi:hypothetical protein
MKRVGKHITKSVGRDAMYPIVMNGNRALPPTRDRDEYGGGCISDSDDDAADDDDMNSGSDGDGRKLGRGRRKLRRRLRRSEISTLSACRRSWIRLWARPSCRVRKPPRRGCAHVASRVETHCLKPGYTSLITL